MIKLDCITLQCFHCSTQVFAFQGHIVLFSSWEYSAGRSTCLKKCSSVRARAKLNLLMRSRKIVNHCDILGHQPIASPPHTTTTSWTKSLDSSGSNITIAMAICFYQKVKFKDFHWRFSLKKWFFYIQFWLETPNSNTSQYRFYCFHISFLNIKANTYCVLYHFQ